MFEFLDVLNSSKYFTGVMMILLNIGSRFVEIKLSDSMEAYIKYNVAREVLIFTMAWMGTRNIVVALTLTADDGTYAVDGRVAITDLEAVNNAGKFRIERTGADVVVSVAAFAGDDVGGYENFADSVGGVLDGVTLETTAYSVAGDPGDGYCINFKAKYKGSYGSNIQIQK